jgi:multisubunit Na+/H+ antiporter MnhF subunit
MFDIILITILIFASIIMLGACVYRDVFTQLLFLNVGTSVTSLFICFLGSAKVNSSYIDIALIYFLLSVVAANAYLKFFIQKKNKSREQDAT